MMRGPITYILPDLPWDLLLDPILQDAPAGAVIEVHTEAMHELVERSLAEAGRADIVLRLGRVRSNVQHEEETHP